MVAGIVDELGIVLAARGIDLQILLLIISEKPMMTLSGVRSSWLMVARNRVLAASARSAVGARQIQRLLLHPSRR